MLIHKLKDGHTQTEWSEVYPANINGWRVTVRLLGCVSLLPVTVRHCGLTVMETEDGQRIIADRVDDLLLFW